MRAATDAAAKNQPPPLSARLCATAANGRYRSVLWLESSEAGARDALDRATLLRNPSSFARLVFGRRIPRPKHLAPRAEREVRQLRTGHHHLVMTMYATEWRDLSRADRRQAFLPCPICGTRSLAPLLHLFVGCDAPAAVQSRLTMDADLDAKSRLRSKPPPADAMERLWAILFVFPELALAYLQRCGTLPACPASPWVAAPIARSRLTPPPRAPPTRKTRSRAEGARHLLARCWLNGELGAVAHLNMQCK
ncbi:hypothetical protein DIPPA_18353 [Diplonema papillatum]|nr:hypothetical protein DIPPA_18353 [Diplonema papillatum]